VRWLYHPTDRGTLLSAETCSFLKERPVSYARDTGDGMESYLQH